MSDNLRTVNPRRVSALYAKMLTVPSKHVIAAFPQELRGKILPSALSKPSREVVRGREVILIPNTFMNCRALHKHGFWPNGPITYRYSWPGKFKPFAHQRITADFLTWYKRAFCFNDIGTAKTLSALWAADFLLTIGAIRKVIIISTLSTLTSVWADEIFNHFPNRRSQVLHGTKQRRIKRLGLPAEYIIINHEGLKVIPNELHALTNIDLVIVDEGAEFSNARTDKYAVLDYLYGPHNTQPRVWWLTGSPTPGDPTDIWAQCKMIAPESVPRYFSRFREQVMYQVDQFKWVARPRWQDYIQSVAQPSIRFSRDQCLDLPELLPPSKRYIPMTPEQKAAYTKMHKELVLELRQGKITAANEGVKRGKLLQIAAGAVYDELGQTHVFNIGPRLQAVKEIVREAGNKVIIYASYKHILAILYKELIKTWTVGLIQSGVSQTARNRIYYDFQHSELQIILAHPKTMAHGLTLTKSHVILCYGPCPSYRIYEQAIGRITRPGQVRQQVVIQLSSSPIETGTFTRHTNMDEAHGILKELLLTPLDI